MHVMSNVRLQLALLRGLYEQLRTARPTHMKSVFVHSTVRSRYTRLAGFCRLAPMMYSHVEYFNYSLHALRTITPYSARVYSCVYETICCFRRSVYNWLYYAGSTSSSGRRVRHTWSDRAWVYIKWRQLSQQILLCNNSNNFYLLF
jgi:hypothetical protein